MCATETVGLIIEILHCHKKTDCITSESKLLPIQCATFELKLVSAQCGLHHCNAYISNEENYQRGQSHFQRSRLDNITVYRDSGGRNEEAKKRVCLFWLGVSALRRFDVPLILPMPNVNGLLSFKNPFIYIL